MEAILDIKRFWSSLITEKGIIPHIESLMKITDAEERGIALMSRVFFLWCMGLKFEREDLKQRILQIEDIINKGGDTSCLNCSDIKSLIIKDFDGVHLNPSECKKTDDLCNLDSGTCKKKLNDHSPQKAKRLRKENKENVDSSPEQASSLVILVPETELFTQEVIFPQQKFVIPETIPADEIHYGNTDFFGDSQKCDFELSPEPKINKSPVLGKLKSNVTPVQRKFKTSSILQSPERVSTNLSPDRKLEAKFVEKSVLKSPDSLNSSPSLLGCNRIKSLRSPTKKNDLTLQSLTKKKDFTLKSPTKKNDFTSLFKEKQNISPPLIRTDSVGASSKPSSTNVKTPRTSRSSQKQNITPPSKRTESTGASAKPFSANVKTPITLHSSALDNFSTSTRKPWSKTRSEVGNMLSRRMKLSRIKTLTSLRDSRSSIEVGLDPPIGKKNYRQTKITEDCFIRNNTNVANLTGGKSATVQLIDPDDDKAIAMAIEESIHTKEIEDILRQKHQQLDKESPGKKKKLTREQNKKEPSLERSNTEQSLESEIRKSPRIKRQKSPSLAGPSGLSSQVSVEEVLADLEGRKEEEKKMEEKPNRLRRNRTKKTVLLDSFDMIPAKEDEPAFAYKGSVARKNQDKKRLDGWDCHECRDYYELKGLSSGEKKELQNKCSRHRSKHKPVTNTPEGFWVVGWSDDENTCK